MTARTSILWQGYCYITTRSAIASGRQSIFVAYPNWGQLILTADAFVIESGLQLLEIPFSAVSAVDIYRTHRFIRQIPILHLVIHFRQGKYARSLALLPSPNGYPAIWVVNAQVRDWWEQLSQLPALATRLHAPPHWPTTEQVIGGLALIMAIFLGGIFGAVAIYLGLLHLLLG